MSNEWNMHENMNVSAPRNAEPVTQMRTSDLRKPQDGARGSLLAVAALFGLVVSAPPRLAPLLS